ncbi:MAG: hypothetical protein GY758_10430 [Fuerstiella sp.]|nr:hypothetical protein [Fuerstiella sp.]MCP4782182.1 hypothetical protein [Fuerstiella sp.]MCP4859452.1 hypothetical protein [Fuerstiella sp.]
MNFRKSFADAAAWWERKRLVYNAVLVLLAVICWGQEIVQGGPHTWLGGGIVLLVFAVIANVLFCVAYPVDLAVQASPLRNIRTGTRWALFLSGLTLASTLALWVLLGTGMA